MIDSCIGADPGPTTGLAFLDYDGGRLVGRTVMQVAGTDAVIVLNAMIATYYGAGKGIGKRTGSVEKFVTGPGAGSRGPAAEVTRQLVMELAEALEMCGYLTVIRPAADVKPWATNRRIAAALGIDEKKIPGSLVHGYDAVRHCLRGARDAGVIADPLLRRSM